MSITDLHTSIKVDIQDCKAELDMAFGRLQNHKASQQPITEEAELECYELLLALLKRQNNCIHYLNELNRTLLLRVESSEKVAAQLTNDLQAAVVTLSQNSAAAQQEITKMAQATHLSASKNISLTFRELLWLVLGGSIGTALIIHGGKIANAIKGLTL